MKASRHHAKGASAEEWSKAGSFMRKPERGWLHSDQAIKEGGVCYALKYLGCIEVLKSMRTLQFDIRQHVTKEAMYRCCEANGYKFSKRKKAHKNVVKLLADHPRTSHSGTFISLTVSVAGLIMTDMSSGEVISKHDMQGISFASGGEKDCPDIVGYVAKDAKNRRACHVLDCPQNLSYDVINTIGQAFELRYKMFLDDPPQLLTTPKRFEGAIFGEDKTMDRTYDEPRIEVGFSDNDDEFDDVHDYDSPTEDQMPVDMCHDYQTPHPQEPPCKMSNYDTLESTLDNRTGAFEVERPTSMEFTVGTQFNSAASGLAVTTPSYNNPLASVKKSENRDVLHENFEMSVNANGQETNTPSFRSSWETFNDDAFQHPVPAPRNKPVDNGLDPVIPPRAKTVGTGAEPSTEDTIPNHNTLGYALPLPKKPLDEGARKTPPPLPKPYSRYRENTASKVLDDAPVTSEKGLLDHVWFHGPMTRQDAENLLSRDGDFLVRESTTNPGQYVLSGQQNGYPKHLLLVDPQGVVRTRDQSFDSVGHLIRHHQENKVPIISSGSVLILRQPVIKNSGIAIYDGPV